MGSAAIDTYLINQNRSRISSFVRCLASVFVIRTSRSIRLSEQTTLPLMVWSSFIIPRNYKKEFIYYTILKKGHSSLNLLFSTASSLSASTDRLVAASSNSYDSADSNAYVMYDSVDERSDYSL